jgi:hypothetical protein
MLPSEANMKDLIERLEEARFGKGYQTKKKGSFSDVLVTSPNGDSILVGGSEVYPSDVPNQLERASGFEMPKRIADKLARELEKALRSGAYIEKVVEYKNGKWKI